LFFGTIPNFIETFFGACLFAPAASKSHRAIRCYSSGLATLALAGYPLPSLARVKVTLFSFIKYQYNE
jgi:hypothetical protein